MNLDRAGLGAFAAPLVATHFAVQRHWYFHYLISAAIGISNVAFLTWAYEFKTQDGASLSSSSFFTSFSCLFKGTDFGE